MTVEQRKSVIKQLNGRTQMLAFEAAKAVWNDPDVELERPLIDTLKNGKRVFNRTAAAFAMQMLLTIRTVSALERTLSNKSEHARVRAEAAESLAHNHGKRSHRILMENLDDSSKDVRFWCAFSLGQMGERRAIAALRRIAATDQRRLKGFHSVAKEAENSIEEILKRSERCLFCRI